MVKNIAIVSLSAGTIGEDFVKHEVDIGLKRLADYGVNVKMMPHAQAGIDYVRNHPEKRAEDLIRAFADESIDMILCAIGGDDTYRLAPHLFENDALQQALKKKIFLGFSDTTMNHLMLHKLGLNSFYGQSFLADVCELEDEMLPYTAHYFGELLRTGRIREVVPSDVWCEERTDWSAKAIGTPRKRHPNEGFQLLQGAPTFHGKILGGCLETLYDIFNNARYPDSVAVCERYGLFPTPEDWRGRILLLETSEERSSPEHYRRMLEALKRTGVFGAVSGVLCGKPMDEVFFEEYKRIIVEVVNDPQLPILANLNIGHATPRCILPFGVHATVDAEAQRITFDYDCHPAG